MCGIAGKLSFKYNLTAPEIQAMTDTLNHRGPDACGVYISTDSCCGLGHARLSIIDLDGGSQPMTNEDKTIWLTFNGECYNFAELKTKLIAAGHIFKTNSDSEVIIHLYEQYGQSCVEHLRGMFAFAIWDDKNKTLFLARDRMGQKPLFYSIDNNSVTFASEPKAILQNQPALAEIDNAAITEYLIFGYLGNTSSGFNNIKKLPPASTLTVNAAATTHQRHTYWQLPDQRSFSGSYANAVSKVKDTIIDAVQMRMVSDVPLGSFLSGGIDSTIITGIMAAHSPSPIKTCGIGFDNQLYNELEYSRIAADAFSCEHKEYIVKPDCSNTIQKLIDHYDEPFADCSALPTWHLCQLTRKNVTVALSGDGGDECFAGYKRHKAIALAAAIRNNIILGRLAKLKAFSSFSASEHHSRLHYLKRFMAAASLPTWQCYLSWLGVFSDDYLCQLTSLESLPAHTKLARDLFSSAAMPTDAALLFDGSHYLPANLNTKTDRASMAHSLEVRSPFQDHKVVELAYSLPTKWLTGSRNGKKILRDAFHEILPDKIKNRSKMGFGVPVGQWFRNELRHMYIDLVINGSFVANGTLKKQAVEKLLSDNDQHITDNGQKLWTLLTLELWANRWLK